MGRLDHGLQQRSDDVVLTAMGKRAAASASMVVGHEVTGKIKFPVLLMEGGWKAAVCGTGWRR
jgi:hypothetical protein